MMVTHCWLTNWSYDLVWYCSCRNVIFRSSHIVLVARPRKYLNVISEASEKRSGGGSAWAGALIWLAQGHCEPEWQPLMGALER